jgi:hypothetical protein
VLSEYASGYDYSIRYDQAWCASFFNAAPKTTDSTTETSTAPVTAYTVTAQVSSIVGTYTPYTSPIILGSSISTLTDSSYLTTGTSSGLTIISGYNGYLQAPVVLIAWQSTDSVVLDWLKTQNISKVHPPANGTAGPTLPPKPRPGISGGAIAGIVVGAIAGLGFIIGALLLYLRRRRKPEPEHPATMIEHAAGK